MSNFEHALEVLVSGGVIAYPTEGVFGVGCDPDNPEAINKLLEIKKRPANKGLILIAASYEQLLPYVDESALSKQQLEHILNTWPGPFTWVMPASSKTSSLVSGQFDTVAVRVTDYPLVQQLCLAFGKPITSTSANLSGYPPCRTVQEVSEQMGQEDVVIVNGETGEKQSF